MAWSRAQRLGSYIAFSLRATCCVDVNVDGNRRIRSDATCCSENVPETGADCVQDGTLHVRIARPFLVVLLVWGGALGAPHADDAKPLEATVADASGPVANATVRLVELAPSPCPCRAIEDQEGYGNEMPQCRCPAVLASWQARLASCQWPARSVVSAKSASLGPAEARSTPEGSAKSIAVRSDARGKVSLERVKHANAIEVSTARGGRWLPFPGGSEPIALELQESINVLVRITTKDGSALPAATKAALLFTDGHCMPLVRGTDSWRPYAPIPRPDEKDEAVFVVESPGYTPVVHAWYESDAVEIELRRATAISGSCKGTHVRVTNPLQTLGGRVDSKRRFSVTGALAIRSDVTCFRDKKVVEEWSYDPEYGLSPTGAVGSIGSQCHDIKVVDANARPVENADVTFWDSPRPTKPMPNGHFSSGHGSTTDARGIACVSDMFDGGELAVIAPSELGGECAGSVRIPVRSRHLTKPPTIKLPIAPQPRMIIKGHVRSPEGYPVAGADIGASESASNRPCDSGGNGATTGLDGSYAFAIPRGKLDVVVEHRWYARHEVTVTHDGSAHDFVLDRGKRWSGRVLDPEGKPITTCSLYLEPANGRRQSATCDAKGGFTFTALSPGDAKVTVRIERSSLGSHRALSKKITFAKDRKAHVEELRFASGEHISGRVVDAKGAPAAGVSLAVIPHGQRRPQNQRHPDEVSIETDANGRFTFRHLEPGTWTISVGLANGKEITLDAATGTTTAELVVP